MCRLRNPSGRWTVGTKRVLILLGDFNSALVDINASRLRRGVTEDRLDRRFADAAMDHFGGESVAEGMGRDLAFDPQRFAELGDDVFNGARADGRPGIAEFIASAEGWECARPSQGIAASAPVTLQRLGRLGVEVDGAAFATLCSIDARGALTKFDIPSPECAQFGDADPR